MKVRELIEALSSLDGNLIVYGYCDHGQTPQMVTTPSVCFTEEIQYTLWEGWTDEKEGAEAAEYTHKFVLL